MAERPPKADKILVEQRVNAVLALIYRGWSANRIVQNVSQTWGVTTRSGYGYVRRARTRLEELTAHKRDRLLGEMLGRHDDLRERGYADGDHRLVLDVDKEDAKLLGLYQPEKHEVEHGLTPGTIDAAIERELQRLALRREGGGPEEAQGDDG